MADFLKTISGVLLALVLGICLSKQAKDWSMLLSVAVCCMVMAVAARFFIPLIRFMEKLQDTAQLDREVLSVLLKAVGVGLVGEFASLICQDSGFSSLGKGIQILTTATVLWLALPLMESLLDIVGKILEGA